MSSSRASGHDGEGRSGGFEELGEDISLGLAGADVWIVFVNVLKDLLLESSFEGEVVEGSEGLPHVGTEGKDGASKGVKCLEEVETKISSSSHNDSLDKETTAQYQLTIKIEDDDKDAPKSDSFLCIGC